MQIKSKQAIRHLIMSLSLTTSAAYSQPAEIQNAQNLLDITAKSFGEENPRYRYQLLNLASTYHRYGENEKADATFARLMSWYEQHPDESANRHKDVFKWATMLVSTLKSNGVLHGVPVSAADQLKAVQAMSDEAKKIEDPVVDTDFTLKRATIYRTIKDAKAEHHLLIELDKKLKELEKSTSNRLEATKVAGLFMRASSYYCPHFSSSGFGLGKRPEIIDGPSRRPDFISKNDFALAENYWLRAIALEEKFDASSMVIQQHLRSLVEWYQYWGDIANAGTQRAKLSRIMKTNDPKKLFPRRCAAGCGMG